jgi:hypothetical protein
LTLSISGCPCEPDSPTLILLCSQPRILPGETATVDLSPHSDPITLPTFDVCGSRPRPNVPPPEHLS